LYLRTLEDRGDFPQTRQGVIWKVPMIKTAVNSRTAIRRAGRAG